jgi:hypothetical protein
MIVGAAADAALLCLGVARYPAAITTATDGALGLIGPLAILLAYALIGQFASPVALRRTNGEAALRLGPLFGAVIGVSFFHLLLGPLLAALMGALGGLAGAGLALVRRAQKWPR